MLVTMLCVAMSLSTLLIPAVVCVGSYRSKVGERLRPFFGDLSSRFGGYGKVGCENG